jgi:hypothetical protein
MKRLLRLGIILLAAFCVATLIAEAAVVTVVGLKWQITREKLATMVAVAQGADLAAPQPEPSPAKEKEEPRAEQVSYEQVIEARAMKARNLELREQALQNSQEQLRVEQGKLADEQAELAQIRKSFGEQLAVLEKRETDTGWAQNVLDLSGLKPKMAKEHLLLMLKKSEADQVVSLLKPMSDARRTKILAEFKTPEELEKAAEILRLIRMGEPVKDAAAEAAQQLNRAQSAIPPEIRQ